MDKAVLTYVAVHCKATTATGYRQWVDKYLIPALGDRRLHEVTRADIKRLIADLAGRGLKKQTIHNILTPFKEAYNHAMDDGLVATNPVARTGRLTRSKDARRRRRRLLAESPLVPGDLKSPRKRGGMSRELR